jgi:ribokinase
VTQGGPPDLAVVGDVMLDVNVASGALASGGDVHGEVRIRPGGSATNAAAWAAHAGARVVLYGAVGDDEAGRLLELAVAGAGIEGHLRRIDGARTGAMLVVRRAGDRSMVADRGANACLSPADLPSTLTAGAVLVSGYLLFQPGSEEAARAALDRADAPWIAVDAASWPLVRAYGPDRFFEVTGPATVLLANEDEARALLPDGPEAPRDLAARLGSRYRVVCIKQGARGATMAMDGALVSSSSPAVDEVDPTAAGDAFDGTFLEGLARGRSPEDALESGCAAGAEAAASAENWPVRSDR